mmetsp:Transcript_41293/g.56283  ORF Transcript_41293/g.56283 Transcript_41293/m.56283 type:complete len:188 (-) Transcript_41293:261-824(-)
MRDNKNFPSSGTATVASGGGMGTPGSVATERTVLREGQEEEWGSIHTVETKKRSKPDKKRKPEHDKMRAAAKNRIRVLQQKKEAKNEANKAKMDAMESAWVGRAGGVEKLKLPPARGVQSAGEPSTCSRRGEFDNVDESRSKGGSITTNGRGDRGGSLSSSPFLRDPGDGMKSRRKTTKVVSLSSSR